MRLVLRVSVAEHQLLAADAAAAAGARAALPQLRRCRPADNR